jgi:hypothetical protein
MIPLDHEIQTSDEMAEMENLLAPGSQDRVEDEAGEVVQVCVDALIRGVVMVVGGGPAKVFLDPAAHSLSIPSMGLTVDLGDIRELVFTIAVIEGFPVPELVLLGDASLYDSEVRFQFENQRARLLFALTMKVLRARGGESSVLPIRYL